VTSFVAAALLVGGIVLVIAGAELLFDGLLDLSARLRIPVFTLTVLVSGLELENLAAGIAANAKGLPDAAAGTFLGGATFLALGVTGLGAATSPIRARLAWPVYGWTAVAPLPLLALAGDGELSRVDGALLVGWFVVAMIGLARAGGGAMAFERSGRRRFAVARLIAGLALLSVGGQALGEGMRRAVTRLGVSQALLGNTVVAATVEAEEVARVTVPARRGRGDVALANVFGTVVHFLALNAGVIALVRPLSLDRVTLVLYLPAAVGATVLVSGIAAWRGGVGRVEGIALLTLYAAFVAVAILQATV
jgi:cation:H+ antiporter